MKSKPLFYSLVFVVVLQLLGQSLFFSSEVQAADEGNGTTYYVSTINGDNNNDGKSEGKAFYDLEKINEIELQPGDHVLLEAGSIFMDGYLHIIGSGAEGNPIVIDRYGEGADPEIRTNGQGIWYQDYGTVLDNPGHKNKGYVSSSILLYDVEYIEINNLNISNDPEMYNENYSDLDKMNRTGVAAVAQNKGTVNHIHLNNLNIHDIRGNVYDKHMNNGGIYFTVFKPENEADTGIARYNDIIIENSVVNDVSRWGIAVGYTAYWEPFAGIGEIPDEIVAKYGSSNVIIRNNYIKDPGGDAITAMYLDRPLIEYNVSDGAAKEINPEVYSETGFNRVAAGVWPWKSKNALLQYNEVFDTHLNQDGQAFDADYGDGTIYQYNYSHNNAGGTLMVCCGGAEVVNTVFRYNISQDDLRGVLDLPTNPMAQVYNNVFYIKEGVSFIGKTGGTAAIENNIIYNAGEKKEEDWTKNSNVTYSNNIYYNYTNTPKSDEFAITDDPLFIGAGTGPQQTAGVIHGFDAFEGYKLASNSPAINAGKYIQNNIARDFFNNPIGLIPDIGVHEFDGDEENVDEIYSDIYIVLDEVISGIPKGTTVSELLTNIKKTSSTKLKVENSHGDLGDDDDVLEEDSVLIATFSDGSNKEYALELAKVYSEYPLEGITAEAGSEQTGEGADKAIDGNKNTMWHTDWAGTAQENIWISLDLGAVKPVEMLKYVPRQSGGTNGMFTKYSIYVKENESDDWTKVETYEDTWEVNTDTKFAYFDSIDTRYIKLHSEESRTQEPSRLFGTAAEIRVGYEEE